MTIAEDYIPLARSLAKKYTPKGQHFEESDCMSVAYEALTTACNRMDLSKGKAHYIKVTVEGALKRHLTTQRVQGFAGLKRSKYAEAILMDRELDIPEELQGPLESALSTPLCLDEPAHFEDGEKGSLVETVDLGIPSVEEECIAHERQRYLEEELLDWKTRFLEDEFQRLYFDEVKMGGKSQAQFRKEQGLSEAKTKKIKDFVDAEFEESASYIFHNLEDMY